MKPIALLLLIPALASASELQLACNLERSKAEVRASTLAAPAAYASVGQDPSTGEKSALAGVSQSFSGIVQAGLVRDAAEAKCDALHSTLQLDEHARWSQLQVQREAARIELAITEKAIALAKTHISHLDAQLTAQVITINQHTEARQTLVSLENRRATLMRTLSTVINTPPNSNITSLLEASRQSEAKAAELAAKAQAETGWDITVVVGGRTPIGSSSSSSGNASSTQAYGTIGFRYSFGSGAAQQAARDVGRDTRLLLAAQNGGYTQTVLRQRETLLALTQAETLAASTSERQATHLRKVRATLVGIDTALALNTLRALDIQLLVLDADAEGAESRLAGYKALLEKLQ